jgi:hypothetical protein
MKNPNKFFKCECYTHALEVEYDAEDNQYYVAVWELGRRDATLNWKERCRWMWHILKTGKPWADTVILSPEQMRQLADFVDEKD